MRLLLRRPPDPEMDARRIAARAEAEAARIMARADAQGHVRTVEREQARIERQAAIEDRRRDRIVARQRRADRARTLKGWGEVNGRRFVLVAPLILVNVLALSGQVGFAEKYLKWDLPAAIMFGLTVESIAVYIGWHAHTALLSGGSAVKLRTASYLMGFLVGGLNFEHYAGAHGKPTVPAVTFGLMSVISPWLWAMHGRHQNARRLRELGLVDGRSPHFSAAKWLHFPGQTMGALRWGIRKGVQDPAVAWDGYQSERATRPPRLAWWRRTPPARVPMPIAPILISRPVVATTVAPPVAPSPAIVAPATDGATDCDDEQELATDQGAPVDLPTRYRADLATLSQSDRIRYAVSELEERDGGPVDPGTVVAWLTVYAEPVPRQRVCDVIRRDTNSGRHRLAMVPSHDHEAATG